MKIICILALLTISLSALAEKNECIQIGDIKNPWHYIRLPDGMSEVRWDATDLVTSITFRIEKNKFNEWLEKCSIKLTSHPTWNYWSIADEHEQFGADIYQSVKTQRVCIQLSKTNVPETPPNPKGYSWCASVVQSN